MNKEENQVEKTTEDLVCDEPTFFGVGETLEDAIRRNEELAKEPFHLSDPNSPDSCTPADQPTFSHQLTYKLAGQPDGTVDWKAAYFALKAAYDILEAGHK